MNFKSMRQISLPNELSGEKESPVKINTFQRKLDRTRSEIITSKKEFGLKLPAIKGAMLTQETDLIGESWKKMKTDCDIPDNYESQIQAENKLKDLLNSIDSTLREERNKTKLIQRQINQRVQRIHSHIDQCSKETIDNAQMDRLMFSDMEKHKVLRSYNNQMRSLYTNTPSGIQYFKKSILSKESDFGHLLSGTYL